MEILYEAIAITSVWEWFAVITSILYVILMAYHKISAWYFAALSSVIYIYICFEAHLFLDSALQMMYLFMACYGWYSWKEQTNEERSKHLPLTTILVVVGFGVLASAITGWAFSRYTTQVSPYLDSSIFIFSILATFMASKSFVENWLFWIVIDLFAVYLFGSRELYLTALLYLIFTFMAIFGYFKWRQIYFRQHYD